jgi:hypothetical protein
MVLILALVILLGVAVYFASFLPSADWYVTFDPAARGIFSGHSPYEQPVFLNPPWAVLLLFPFVIFPPIVAHGLFFVASALALIYLAWRLSASPLTMAALMLSPTAVGVLLVGNLDALVYLGMLLPPVSGLFLLLLKPQIGAGVAIYYLIESWRQGRFSSILRTFSPIAIAYLISALVFPIFIERIINKPSTDAWNRSLFPYAIPIGLFFLWLAVRKQNAYFALAATPFLTPYLTVYSYLAVQMALMHKDVEKVIRRDVLQIILTIFLWIIWLLFHPG